MATPTIDKKQIAGTNANGTSASSISFTYDHPGGDLIVFFRHSNIIDSGYAVTFNSVDIPVLSTSETDSTDSQPGTGGLAIKENVTAANATLEVSWTNGRTQRGVMVFSVGGSDGVRAWSLTTLSTTTTPSSSVTSVANDLVLVGMMWRNSSRNVDGRGTGQTDELADDSPTRQQADSKVGTTTSTSMSFTMSATDADQGFVLHTVSLKEPSVSTAVKDVLMGGIVAFAR